MVSEIFMVWAFVATLVVTAGLFLTLLPKFRNLTGPGVMLIGGIVVSLGVVTAAIGYKIMGHNADWHYYVLGFTMMPPAISILIALARYRNHRGAVYYHVFKRPMKE